MSNYKAIIAKIDSVLPIEGADRIQIAKVLGESVIVSKELNIGYTGVFFCSGTQLSEEFCKNNNLYRKSEMNNDNTKSGFFEINRKVRAQPFMKVRSEGYFAGLESLKFVNDLPELKVGDSFEVLGDVRICNKYINPNTKQANNQQKKLKKKDVPNFLKHVDTAQFRHKLQTIEKGSLISIQAKVHGTSARYTKMDVDVSSKLNWLQKQLNRLGDFFPTTQEQFVVGTRNVILDDPDKESFHGKEQFRFDVLETLKPHIEKNMTIYGEIAGYANNKPIMATHDIKGLKDKKFTKKYGKEPIVYKYGCPQGELRFHVYRITVLNEEGMTTDFTQQQIVKWCNDKGILPALDVIEPFLFDGDYDRLSELVEQLTERPEMLTEDYIDHSHISEGVIIRIDDGNRTPTFLKSKSYAFKVLEGICEAVDLEDES